MKPNPPRAAGWLRRRLGRNLVLTFAMLQTTTRTDLLSVAGYAGRPGLPISCASSVA